VAETASRKQAGRHTEGIWYGKRLIMTFAHRSSRYLFYCIAAGSERKERQTVGMYVNMFRKRKIHTF
jgi:hypothetical protein